MTDNAGTAFAPLRDIISANAAWLTERIRLYAKRQAYCRHAPALKANWRRSINDISALLIQGLETVSDRIELSPDDDLTIDPLARFGIQEAECQRERGVPLVLFLGLLKYYRQSYLDLVQQEFTEPSQREPFTRVIRRFFDRIEMGLCMAWQTAEAELQETTIWLMGMFNALEEAVFIASPNGRIADANKAAQRIFGYSAVELKNLAPATLHVDKAHYETFTHRLREALPKSKQVAFEYEAKRRNGEIFPVWVNVKKLTKPDGTPLGLISVLRDISPLKLAEKAACNNERLQGVLELAGAVCHDLNQPLMAIAGYAELLLMDCAEDAPQYPKLKKIVEQVSKVGDITHKLMRVTRYETKPYLDQRIVDIDKSADRR